MAQNKLTIKPFTSKCATMATVEYRGEVEYVESCDNAQGFTGFVVPFDLRDNAAEIKAAIVAALNGVTTVLDYTDEAAEAKRVIDCDAIDAHQARMAHVMAVQG